ncbi:hypothetical protein MKO06_10735 [Gramella sp. GC03-9]|uniref:Uncharacterized protein n=1 Tax=Christiangramia oceanisediminis TaxID=2920386 RepID=A0A9X2KY09_9FLAO|nr:hypothetical protein [Gramella oceanisediminis]MCP9200388.1 hypothetical protein [Gramella oceanisediminis]
MMEKKVNRPEEEKKKGKPDNLPYNPDVTSEDKQALNQKGRSMNKGQDKDLDRERDVDFTSDEMDIPASGANDPEEGDLPDAQNYQYNKKGKREDWEKSKDHPKSDKKI